MPAIARAGSNQVIPYSDLPAVVALDGTASTPGAGSIITWEWVLRWPTDGSVTIAGANTSTPTLTMTEPVSARVSLNVEDSIDGWAWDHADPDAYYDLPVLMPTAYVEVSATTQHAALQIPALGERHDERVGSENDLMGKWAALFNRVDSLQGDLNGVSVSVSTLHTKWIQAGNGEVAADGSMNAPYNPLSAADQGFGGPWEQAIAALQALDISVNPAMPRTIYALGGIYAEDPTILDADGPWAIVCDGVVEFALGENITYTSGGVTIDTPHFSISPATEGSYLLGADLLLGNSGATPYRISVRNAYLGSVGVSGSFAASPLWYSYNTGISGAFNVPNLRLTYTHNCSFEGAVTVLSIDRAITPFFGGNITVTDDPAQDERAGIFGAMFPPSVVWTGPANSAIFDAASIEVFNAMGGTFSGGAGTADFWAKQWTWRFPAAPVTLTNIGSDTNFATFKVGAGLRGVVEIDALLSATIDVADSFKLSICIAPDGGTPLSTVATQLAPLAAGASIPIVRLHAELSFLDVDATGAVYGTYRVIYDDAVGDVIDEGRFYTTSLDLDPAFMTVAIRAQRIGTFGAGSSATLYWAKITYRAED